MRTSARITALCALLMLFAVGCGDTRTYSVSVTNNTKQPITIGFTHDGETDTDVWIPPNELAMDKTVRPENSSWGILVAPGRTASTKKPMVAHMDDSNDNAYVRVYRGEMNLLQILATDRNSPNRVDVPLMEGQNNLSISDKDGKLAAVRTDR